MDLSMHIDLVTVCETCGKVLVPNDKVIKLIQENPGRLGCGRCGGTLVLKNFFMIQNNIYYEKKRKLRKMDFRKNAEMH